MEDKPQEHSRFTVTSGSLCYGPLHSIFQGASHPTQRFDPPRVQTPHEIGGTVMIQKFIHNTSAQNGTWITYQLIDLEWGGAVSAWFACHCDIDPEKEIDKILRVSGSPYEMDSGSRWNNDETAREGVLVINRYDWVYGNIPEEYGKEVQPDDVQPPREYDVGLYNSVGLVDYGHAGKQIGEWIDQLPDERAQIEHGAWFYIPHGEYMFARFGFDNAHTAARSFLFFTTNTRFDETMFRGLSKSLRLKETMEERFERHLREGDKYEGFETLSLILESTMGAQQHYPPHSVLFEGRPVESECLGPYDKNEYVLKEADIEPIRIAAEAVEIPDVLKEPVFDLLNEMTLSYLDQYIVPASSERSVLAAAAALCPEPGTTKEPRFIRPWVKVYVADPLRDPIRGFNFDEIASRIKAFLKPRCGNQTLVEDDGFNIGIASAVRYLMAEILKSASQASRDNQRLITPSDIRLSTHHDGESRTMIRLCRMYWYGYPKM